MTQSKTDPRVLRTRKLIMDSFIDLSGKKEFKDITIKDITTEAMINRATFYYHFEDICIKSINASLEGLMLSFLKGSNLFAPHDAASVMCLGSEGLDHKLYY